MIGRSEDDGSTRPMAGALDFMEDRGQAIVEWVGRRRQLLVERMNVDSILFFALLLTAFTLLVVAPISDAGGTGPLPWLPSGEPPTSAAVRELWEPGARRWAGGTIAVFLLGWLSAWAWLVLGVVRTLDGMERSSRRARIRRARRIGRILLGGGAALPVVSIVRSMACGLALTGFGAMAPLALGLFVLEAVGLGWLLAFAVLARPVAAGRWTRLVELGERAAGRGTYVMGSLAGAALVALPWLTVGRMGAVAIAVVGLGVLAVPFGALAVPVWQVDEERDVPKPPKSRVPLVFAPAGEFEMGSPEDERGRQEDEGPVHAVRLSPFWIGSVPVTRSLVAEVMGRAESDRGGDLEDSHPATGLSWLDAVEFCNRLSELEGREPVYRLKGEYRAVRIEGKSGFRLPTEAEWEYACRAGTRTRFWSGDSEKDLGRVGWYGRNSGGSVRPVGQKEPNAWGLHDVHGNTWEWCEDCFGGSKYSKRAGGVAVDPVAPASGTEHAIRGGSYWYDAGMCRSAKRNKFHTTSRLGFIGFRVVLPAGREH